MSVDKTINKRQFRPSFLVFVFLLLLAAILGGIYWQHHIISEDNKKLGNLSEQIKSLAKQVNVLVTPKPITFSGSKSSSTPSYSVGDTQTDGNITIKLDKTYTLTQSQVPMPIPTNDILFGVELTVTNNGNTPANEEIGNGLTELSTVYTQIGTNTSTGNYVLPDTGNESAGCIGNSVDIINPGQTINTCLQFAVPSNVLVDTYFYDNLKWYL